jgi:hypothetical protein
MRTCAHTHISKKKKKNRVFTVHHVMKNEELKSKKEGKKEGKDYN